MVRAYTKYLQVQKPGVRDFRGTRYSARATDDRGNIVNITVTMEDDCPTCDPDDAEQLMYESGEVEVKEKAKADIEGRSVSKKKTVLGKYQAAALGHPGAQADCAAEQKRIREAAEAEAARKAAELAAKQQQS